MTANAFHNISQIESNLWEAADQLEGKIPKRPLGKADFIKQEGLHTTKRVTFYRQEKTATASRLALFLLVAFKTVMSSKSNIHMDMAWLKFLMSKIKNLRAVRELLLPRLISGELAV